MIVDPWETHDLYGDSGMADVKARLFALRDEQRAIWEHDGAQSVGFWKG